MTTVGPYVIKRVAGREARRRYYSEIAARGILAGCGASAVEIVARVDALRVFVMRHAGPTLNRMLDAARLRAFGDLVKAQAALPLARGTQAGYYWVDAASRRRVHGEFTDFLASEFAAVEAEFVRAYPAVDADALKATFAAAAKQPDRTLVLTDVAPKNVVYVDGVLIHLDLEATLVGPSEFLLVKAAVNLATDVGDRHEARSVRRGLLDACASPATARACLAWAMVRRLLHESRAGRQDRRPAAALNAVLEGRELDEAILHIEASWDAERAGQPAAAGR